MSGTLLVDLHASLLRLSSNFATQVEPLTGKPIGAIYFDAHADDDTLPSGDHVGLAGLTFELDSHFVEGTFMIGVTTQTDANLFRLMKAMNYILSKLIPGGRIDVIDATTGAKKGFLAIQDGTRLMAVSGKVERPIQFISVEFQTTLDYRP